MKKTFKPLLLLSAIAVISTGIENVYASNFQDDQIEEKNTTKLNTGNWTGTFKLKDGSTIVHTPSYVKMGFITAGAGLHMECKFINSMKLSAPLILKTSMNREAFLKGLKIAGLLK